MSSGARLVGFLRRVRWFEISLHVTCRINTSTPIEQSCSMQIFAYSYKYYALLAATNTYKYYALLAATNIQKFDEV